MSALLIVYCSDYHREPFQSICVIFEAFFQRMSTLPEKFQIMSTYADWTSVCRHCLKNSAYVDIRGFHRLTVTYMPKKWAILRHYQDHDWLIQEWYIKLVNNIISVVINVTCFVKSKKHFLLVLAVVRTILLSLHATITSCQLRPGLIINSRPSKNRA